MFVYCHRVNHRYSDLGVGVADGWPRDRATQLFGDGDLLLY
jgi:hypothetical protein